MVHKLRGFTIVEMAVVITVIAILTSIVVVSYRSADENARASQIVSSLDTVEKSLDKYALDQNWTTWPNENVLGGSLSPSVEDIILNSDDFSSYLREAPQIDKVDSDDFWYDNDGDSTAISSCTSINAGVNLVIQYPHVSVAEKVDAAIDDGNIACGKVRYSTAWSELYYKLDNDSTID